MLKTRLIKFIIAVNLLLLSVLINAEVTAYKANIQAQFSGKAYDINTNKLVYSEHHNYLSEKLHIVDYKEVNGDVFATKEIDYSDSYFSPNIIQANTRNGEKITTKKSNGTMKISYQENNKYNKEKNTIDFTPSLVVDAGFNHFITHNWHNLIKGKELTIDYLIPSRLDHYELRIKKVPCDTDEFYCFNISAASFVIRMFSSDLRLTYEIYNTIPRLKSFQGRSNICDNQGKYQDVKIIYRYDNPTASSSQKF